MTCQPSGSIITVDTSSDTRFVPFDRYSMRPVMHVRYMLIHRVNGQICFMANGMPLHVCGIL